MSETIHERLMQVIRREEMSVAAFERALNVGRNSISTSLRKEASITHEVLQKIAERFPYYSIEWLILGEKSEKTLEIQKLSAEVFRIYEAWKEASDKISLQK